MSKPLEVRATVSFDAFRQGRVYEVDLEDDRMMSLLGVGYLEPTSDLEDDDAGLDRSSQLDVGGDRGGAAVHRDGVDRLLEASEGVSDVADRPESGNDSGVGTSKRVRGGKATGITDSGRGSDSGEVGNA